MELSQEPSTSEQPFIAGILLKIALFTASLTLVQFDLYLSIFLKFISIASFICYLLINQDNIRSGWIKFKKKFKKK